MYQIAIVRFLNEAGEEAGREYEYRIPGFMDEEVEADMLGVVNWRGNQRINPSAVRIKSIKSVLDGEFNGEYAYLIGAFSTARYEALIQEDRRRKRLLELLKVERQRLVSEMDMEALAQFSPVAAELLAELKGLGKKEETKEG